MNDYSKKPIVGFFPLFYNLAETGRAILVAKRYVELGGEVVFFSHGGEYEQLARELGYKIIQLDPIFTEESIKRIVSINRREKKGIAYAEDFLRESVKNEVLAYKKTGISMIISFVNMSCSISARVAKIPLVCITPGVGTFYVSYPDYFENSITRFIPKYFKIQFLNWDFAHGKKFLKPFNKVAREYNLKPFRCSAEVTRGDVNLATNFLEFINIFPNQQEFPDKDYVGIILLDELFSKKFPEEKTSQINKEIENHLKRPGRSILLTMGSSGDKQLFLNILQALNKTRYNVIAVYANILRENEIPDLNDNILMKKFVPSIEKANQMVDLAVIHGGQGTVYTAAYAGKPVIGFPMQFEQHLHLEKMVGHGAGLMLSKKYYKEKNLLEAITKIFDNYDEYLTNAKKLAKKIPMPEGDRNSALRLVDILKQYKNNQK